MTSGGGFDDQTRRWIEEKHEPQRGPTDETREAMRRIVEEAGSRDQEAPGSLFGAASAAGAEVGPSPKVAIAEATPAPIPAPAPPAPEPVQEQTAGKAPLAAAGLFDEGEYRSKRHEYDPDAFGRCKTCGVISQGTDGVHAPGLSDKFVVPPFSVLDTRQSYWQARRQAWLSLGIRGETTTEREYRPNGSRGAREDGVWLGSATKPHTSQRAALGTFADDWLQEGNADSPSSAAHRDRLAGGRKQGLIYQHDAPASDPGFYTKKTAVEKRLGRRISIEEFRRDWYDRSEEDLGASQSVQTGTSVFDPVLCEIAYRWFSAPGARVLDPFAGGVVRGLLAAILGRSYLGIELRPEQIADNEAQVEHLFSPASEIAWNPVPSAPRWIEHDATRLSELDVGPVDLVLTCPPYADLEVYSDDPRDLSTMPYERFRACLGDVMGQSASMLRQDRFAVWVVGEARGKAGAEYGLVADTVKAGQAAGLQLYNSAILVNSVGSAALRAQLILRSRKVTRVHQHVLVFLKGDAKRAAAACGSADVDAG